MHRLFFFCLLLLWSSSSSLYSNLLLGFFRGGEIKAHFSSPANIFKRKERSDTCNEPPPIRRDQTWSFAFHRFDVVVVFAPFSYLPLFSHSSLLLSFIVCCCSSTPHITEIRIVACWARSNHISTRSQKNTPNENFSLFLFAASSARCKNIILPVIIIYIEQAGHAAGWRTWFSFQFLRSSPIAAAERAHSRRRYISIEWWRDWTWNDNDEDDENEDELLCEGMPKQQHIYTNLLSSGEPTREENTLTFS